MMWFVEVHWSEVGIANWCNISPMNDYKKGFFSVTIKPGKIIVLINKFQKKFKRNVKKNGKNQQEIKMEIGFSKFRILTKTPIWFLTRGLMQGLKLFCAAHYCSLRFSYGFHNGFTLKRIACLKLFVAHTLFISCKCSKYLSFSPQLPKNTFEFLNFVCIFKIYTLLALA